MNKLQQSIIAINSFSMGILLPVLNLILLEKGSSLQTLPLLLAIYSLTVLCLELPSGMFADIYGRKAVFLLSCGFQLISFSLLIAANSIIWLIFAVIFFGLGRAFSSGSLEALFIDQAIAMNGEGYLAKVTTRLAVLDGAGLALGGIAGGFIASITGIYTSNIVLRLILTAALFILCLTFVEEKPTHDIKQEKQHTSLIELIRQGKQVVLTTPKFGLIFIGVFFIGFLLFSLETYWQPAFMKITTAKNNTWVLGLITFTGFVAVIIGNTIAQKLFDRPEKSWWDGYNICRIIMTGVILVFAFQKSVTGFVSWYAGIYLLLGASNVAESTLINKYTPSNMRASVLSLNSLVAQIGGLCASLFSSVMIIRLQFSGIWIVAGVLLGGCTIVIATVSIKKQAGK